MTTLLAIALLGAAMVSGCGSSSSPSSSGDNGNGGNGGNTDPVPLTNTSSLTDEESRSGRFTTVGGTDGDDNLQLNGARISGAVTLGGGEDTFSMAGASRVTGTVNGGEGADTFIWEGGRLGSGGANSLDLGQLENFEIYRLMPADNSVLMLSAADFPGATSITLGGGGDTFTLNTDLDATIDAGGGADSFIWTGGRLGSAGASGLDLGQLTGFEVYQLMPDDNSALMLSSADFTGATSIVLGRGGDAFTLNSNLDATIDASDGVDSFTWTGGRLGSGGENSLDFGQLKNFEVYRLMPDDNSALMLSATDVTGAISIVLGGGDDTFTLNRDLEATIDAGDGADSFTWTGGRLGSGGVNTLEFSNLSGFENLRLTPASAMLSVTAAQVATAVDTTVANMLEFGTGITLTGDLDVGNEDDSIVLSGGTATGMIDAGGGTDTFTWSSGTVGSTAGTVDFGQLENFENLVLTLAAGITATVTAADLTAALNLSAGNHLTLGSGITLNLGGVLNLGGGDDIFQMKGNSQVSGTVDGGTGFIAFDTFLWEGGTLGEGGANTLDLTKLQNFEILRLTPAGITATVTAAGLTAALDLSVSNTLTLGPGITFNPSDAFDLGGDEDTLEWTGATVGDTRGELDLSKFTGLENLSLTPEAGITAEVMAAGLTAALDLSTDNTLLLGAGITFNPSDAFDLGGGRDRLSWTGATVGEAEGKLDLSKFTALEDLSLVPSAGVQQSFSGEEVTAALNTDSDNSMTMGPGVSITSILDAGAGNDTFDWFGGTVGDGADNSIDFALLQGFEFVSLGAPSGVSLAVDSDSSLAGKGISGLSLGPGVSVSGNTTLTDIAFLEVRGGTLQANVSGTDNNNIYNLRGTVRADLNLMDGIDGVFAGPGEYSGSWDGGPGLDSINAFGSNADDIDLCGVALMNFETGNLLDRGSGSTVCMSSLSFQSLSLEVGESSPRLEIRGDVAAGIELQIDRSYDVRSTDLRRPDALVVGGRFGRFATDGTAGFDCTGGRCDLMLYDRAVPLALSLSAALDASINGALNGALTGSQDGPQDTLKPPEYRSLSSRPVSGSLSQQGSVAWSLDTRSRLNGSLSGAELFGQWRLGRGLGLRHEAAAVHLDVHASGLSSYGGYQITGRITGTDHRLSILWGGRLLGGREGRLGLTGQLAHYRSNSVELFERPVSARLRANIAAVQLAGYHSLLGETTLGLRASARMQAGETSLEGLDGVRAAARSDENKPQWRAGLIGTINPVTQLTKWTAGWSVDYVSMGGGRSAEVLNDRQSDLVRWQQPKEFLQYRLGLSGRLSQRSSLRFELQRQDTLDADQSGPPLRAAAAGLRQDTLDAPAAGQRRDYSARLSFYTSF